MSSTNLVITAPNVEDLEDSDLDAIVDLRFFGFDGWCTGYYEYIGGPAYRCPLCGSEENWGFAARVFGDPHPRQMPPYTKDWLVTWLIVREIKERGLEMLRSFMGHLAVLMVEQGKSMSAISSVTQRMVVIAALQATGTVDQAGYIIARREGVQ